MAERLDDLIRDIHVTSGGAPPEAPPRPPRPRRPAPRPMPPAPVRRGRKALWVVLALLLTAGLVAASVLLQEREGGGLAPEGSGGGWTSEQRVVAWSVWDPREEEVGLALVLGEGGGRPPIALAIPWYTTANVPGYGLATVGEAADLRRPELAAGAVENLLRVQVDEWAGSSIVDVAAAVDAAGGIEVEDRTIQGEAFIQYVRRTIGDEETAGDLRFIRWLEVVSGLLRAAGDGPAGLAGLPPEVAEGLEAASGTDVASLPVESIGSGLARPIPDQVEALVAERFVADRATDTRLVVLNGNGIPGVGKRVSDILAPEGFRLVSSGNAPAFDVEVTQIVAGDRTYLDEARLAHGLLGVGEVLLGEMPTGVADVTVIVGMDFGGP